MNKPDFTLTNEQRKYFGLEPVQPHWEIMQISDVFYYFDGDKIVKEIGSKENFYYECELDVMTTQNRTIVLPKTARGKPKKLNLTATQSFTPYGTYVRFGGSHVVIANYTTQTTYFDRELRRGETIEDFINEWIEGSNDDDLREIEAFKSAKRKHVKYREGDIFAFKIGRREWGYGKILLDISKRRKAPSFKAAKNYGLANLAGTALMVKIYNKKAV